MTFNCRTHQTREVPVRRKDTSLVGIVLVDGSQTIPRGLHDIGDRYRVAAAP